MASFSAHFLVLLVLITLLCVTKIMAQDIAPTSGLETGSGVALSFSGALTCSSVIISLFALLQKFYCWFMDQWSYMTLSSVWFFFFFGEWRYTYMNSCIEIVVCSYKFQYELFLVVICPYSFWLGTYICITWYCYRRQCIYFAAWALDYQ